MKLSKLRSTLCFLSLFTFVQPATAITADRVLSHNSTNSRQQLNPQPSSIAKNPGQCAEGQFPVTVEAPNRNSPSYSGKLNTGVDPVTRCIFFKDVSFIGPVKRMKPKRTWLIIHGWLNDSNSADIKKLADTVAQQQRGDRVLMLDWGEAAMNKGENGRVGDDGQKSIGVYYAASWIRPVAEVAVEQLKSKYGLTGTEAASNLNIIGHSLGTLMAAEIGGIYFGLDPKGNKTGEGVPIKSIIALDPPSELSTNGSLGYDLGGYDVDGRTPAYIFKGKIPIKFKGIPLVGWSMRDLHPEAIDRPKHFDRVSSFSRAFVGKKSLAGNQEFAGWAHESFQMDFGELVDIGGEHGRVVTAFTNLVAQHPLKQPSSKSSFLDLDDLASHSDCSQRSRINFIRCNAYSNNHEGRITIDSNDRATQLNFIQSGTFAEVSIYPNREYSYFIEPNSPGSKNQSYDIRSFGGNPKVTIDNLIVNNLGAGYEDFTIEQSAGRAKITMSQTKTIINFIGTGEISDALEKNKWQITATSGSSQTSVVSTTPAASKPSSYSTTPASVFNPIIGEISQKLPQTRVARLPSHIPNYCKKVKIDPNNKVTDIENQFRLSLTSYSYNYKTYIPCIMIGSLEGSSVRECIQGLYNRYAHFCNYFYRDPSETKVALGGKIIGYYAEYPSQHFGVDSSYTVDLIMWKQDEFIFYIFAIRKNSEDKSEAIKAAISMINSTLIRGSQ